MKRLFTGIQPTGNLHIGNFIGAILNAKKIVQDKECLFCVVDLHAITVDWDIELLNKYTLEIVAIYLAAGFDLNNCSFFVQSHNTDHPYLCWLLNNITPMGWTNSMIQFKEKAEGKDDSVSIGLYDYPVLMAADILLYDADVVPVGEDQKQHVELTRDIAEKFNNKFGPTFKLPEFVANTHGARIRSLQHPDKKMSKSANDPSGKIELLENPDDAFKKVMRAVTDSLGFISYDPVNRPAITNLLDIYSNLSDLTVEEIVKKYDGKGYKEFKQDLGEVVRQYLINFQAKYYQILKDRNEIDMVLKKGVEKARSISSIKLEEVKNKMGFQK